tara:strand:- start:58350 stop:58757 length:408 start_codon:yes stop_codon:yes gene_type:complete
MLFLLNTILIQALERNNIKIINKGRYMSNINVKQIKETLEKEKASLINQLDALKNDKTRKGGAISADWPDQAQEVENDEVVDQLETLELNKLKDVEAALTRIENGSYGSCAVCQNEISEARILAVPFATKCINCS